MSHPTRGRGPTIPGFLADRLLLVAVQGGDSRAFSLRVSTVDSKGKFFRKAGGGAVSTRGYYEDRTFYNATTTFFHSNVYYATNEPNVTRSNEQRSNAVCRYTCSQTKGATRAPILRNRGATLKWDAPSPRLLRRPTIYYTNIDTNTSVTSPKTNTIFSRPLYASQDGRPPLSHLSRHAKYQRKITSRLTKKRQLKTTTSRNRQRRQRHTNRYNEYHIYRNGCHNSHVLYSSRLHLCIH